MILAMNLMQMGMTLDDRAFRLNDVPCFRIMPRAATVRKNSVLKALVRRNVASNRKANLKQRKHDKFPTSTAKIKKELVAWARQSPLTFEKQFGVPAAKVLACV